MDDLNIPPFFICPISLQMMKDPVTLSTGMTYDRESIDLWLFTYKRNACPITKQPLTDFSLTPNTTLLRLIQSWCNDNSSKIISMVERTTPTFDISIFCKLLDEVREPKSQISLIKSLRKIRSVIEESDGNRSYPKEAGVVSLMASLITDADPQEMWHLGDSLETTEEAMNVLFALKPSPESLKKVTEETKGKIVDSLSWVMQRGSYHARIHASLLLKSIFKEVEDKYKTGLKPEIFDSIVEILKDQNSSRAKKAALVILMEVIRMGRNMTRAVEAGVVAVIVELLAEMNERQSCEIMLRVLEVMCMRAEGRTALAAHPASVAVVSTKILRVSQVANERAVNVLLQLCRFCAEGGVVKEMIEVGGAAMVVLVVQAQCSRKAKEMAKEILGLHLRTWSKSICFPAHLLP
ncbi:hypothetical protein MRB53_025688 [Persea americana]|uniref:Uncharacterized protein n=1 Tax=Persea americana TaxID=3435 RepID=A0ACC2LFT9_PERAE|nr:hypothetical protein MRB53_025688 [Persea americana]